MDQKRGFTLIELVIGVALIGLLASIAVSKINDVIRRAQEARTKGNLAILRASIAAYLANSGGSYPSVLEDVTQGPMPVLSKIPLKLTPPYHPEGNSVSNGPRAAMADSRGDWYYFNASADPEYGTVVVNCVHTDLHGKTWSE